MTDRWHIVDDEDAKAEVLEPSIDRLDRRRVQAVVMERRAVHHVMARQVVTAVASVMIASGATVQAIAVLWTRPRFAIVLVLVAMVGALIAARTIRSLLRRPATSAITPPATPDFTSMLNGCPTPAERLRQLQSDDAENRPRGNIANASGPTG